jgi:hypothetical protein
MTFTANGAPMGSRLAAAAGERWYFVRVRDADGQSVAYSSPVWVETAAG